MNYEEASNDLYLRKTIDEENHVIEKWNGETDSFKVYKQKLGIDYFEVFVVVLKLDTIHIWLSYFRFKINEKYTIWMLKYI